MTERLALVFSGGGAKGAFGVGALWELAHRLPRLRWTIVSGTSTGALITPFAALAAEDRGALAELRDFYLRARKKGVVRSNFRIPRLFRSLFDWPEGFFDFRPLQDLVHRTLHSGRMEALARSEVAAVVNSVSLRTGQLVLCTQDRHRRELEAWFQAREEPGATPAYRFLPFSKFPLAMIASSSVPAALEPVALGRDRREQLVDGGVLDIAPLRAAIAAGATHVLAILMSPRRPPPEERYAENLFQVARRSVDLLTGEILKDDVEYAEHLTHLRGLARCLLDEAALPHATSAWIEGHRGLLERLARRRAILTHVLEPPLPLGETLDFDSSTPPGWPDRVEPGAPVNVMEARFECGRRAVARALGEANLPAFLEPFLIGEER